MVAILDVWAVWDHPAEQGCVAPPSQIQKRHGSMDSINHNIEMGDPFESSCMNLNEPCNFSE